MIKMADLYGQYLSIKTDLDRAIEDVIRDSAFINGKYVKKFEEEFASYLGVDYCIGVGNGTDALEIIIKSFDFPEGSEIIVPSNSFIASSEAVSNSNCRVVFCDCNDNYTISLESLREKISEKTKAVIAIHLYGHPCEMDELLEISKTNNLKLIEDCAQAHGAEYKNKKVGTFGDASAFSFYPGKNLGAYGDAGAIVSNNESIAQKVRMIANHGRVEKYDHLFEGRNSRLDGLQAAVLSAKLKYLDKWTSIRIELAEEYMKMLNNVSSIELPKVQPYVKHVYHLFVIKAKLRDSLKDFLFKEGIETGIHYPISLPKLKAYQYLHQADENFASNINDSFLLSLPIGEHLGKSDIEKVVQKLEIFYA